MSLQNDKQTVDGTVNIIKENKMKYELQIEGMMCNRCVAHVTNALKSVQGVTDVTVSLEENKAVVECAAGIADNLKNAVETARLYCKGDKTTMTADNSKITRLLKTARGQIDGILKMIDENRYCIDVSNQIMACQAILSKVNKEVLHAHISSCVINSSGEDKNLS